ncbi:MAG TPA: hypothetical protein VGK00_13275 [Anaerolineales bacterium]|jgi:hypothetical protein
MTKIIRNADCGNSPKNIFLENLSSAFTSDDRVFIHSSITGHIRWIMAGEELVEGKSAFIEALRRKVISEGEEMTVSHVVTHGKAGAVDGLLKLKMGIRLLFITYFNLTAPKAQG